MIVPDEPLAQMRATSLKHPGLGEWYAYTNQALDSASLGETRYLRCGPGCTFKLPPERHPDVPGPDGVIGWKYVLEGVVDLVTGTIERKVEDGRSVQGR